MKKRSIILLAMLMLAFVLSACAGKDNAEKMPEENVPEENVSDENTEETADMDVLSIMNDVWAAYGEDEKFYGMGGDANHAVENAPGNFDLEEKDALAATLLVNEEMSPMIDEAASLVHAMNLNVFTGAAFHVTDPANVGPFAEAMKNNILNNHWMCGAPDRYVIYSVNEEYVVMAFGQMDILPLFMEKFMSVHGDYAVVLADENVAQW